MKRVIPIVLLAAVVVTAAIWLPKRLEKRAEVSELKLSGNIEAHESLVSFKVTGRIVELPVEEGQAVTAGQLLARLDGDDYRETMAADAATARVRDSQLKLSLAGSRSQEIAAASQSLLDLKADLDQKQKDLTRYNELFRKDEVTGQIRDQAETNFIRAKAAYERQQQISNELVEGTRKEQIAVDRASLRQARRNFELSRVRFGYTTLTSPTNGVVLVRQAELGEVVSPGTPVATVADLDHLWVRVYIPETDLGRIHWGQQLAVGADTYPSKRYNGRVSFISSEAEFTPKSVQTERERVTLVYRVKVDLDNPQHELKPGMPADVYVPVQ